MLTQGEDVEAHALRQRGWSISAIARHLNHDRKSVHAYLNGDAHGRGERDGGVPRQPLLDPPGLGGSELTLRRSGRDQDALLLGLGWMR